MWKKTTVLFALVTFCLLAIPASADRQDTTVCVVGQPCPTVHLLLNSTPSNVSVAQCSLTVWNATSLVINNATMQELLGSRYNYTATFNHTGLYTGDIRCSYPSEIARKQVDFAVERKGSTFMGFEIIVPTILFGLALVCLWGATYFGKNVNDRSQEGKYRFALLCAQHGLAIMSVVFLATATFATQEIVRYENVAGNANLTNITNVFDRVIVAEFALFTLLFALIMMFFIIRGITLFREIKLKRINEQEMI